MHSTISLLLVLVTTTAEVFGAGEMIIVSNPQSLHFKGNEPVDVSILSDICSTALGFTTYQTKEFSGVELKDPFHFASNLMVVAVEGVPSLGLNMGHRFPLMNHEPVGDAFNSIEIRSCERNPQCKAAEINSDDDIKKVEFNLNKGALTLRKDSESYLNSNEEYVKSFNHQLSVLDAISNKMVQEASTATEKGIPDILWINMNGLHSIIDFYGESSDTAALARKSLKSAVMQLKEKMDYAHPNKTMIVLVASDSAHTRRFRRAAAKSEFDKDHNIAETYDENYPVFFNIFFWFTIAFIMTIIATSMVTAGMDPGRDSIIYRMTSTRMKKDV